MTGMPILAFGIVFSLSLCGVILALNSIRDALLEIARVLRERESGGKT